MATKTVNPADHVRQAIDELDQARDGASQQAREHIDTALQRLRDAADDLGTRARDQMSEFQDALESAGEDLRIEFGRRAVRAQRSTSALMEIGAEVRRRKAELSS
jgi:vacuolar-type H+-ATPase subunit H